MDNPYEILGVMPSASPGRIRDAWKRRIKACHPDVHPGDTAKEEEFKQVQHAYEILSDPEKRKLFDETGSTDLRDAENINQHAISRMIGLYMAVVEAVQSVESHDIIAECLNQLNMHEQKVLANKDEIPLKMHKLERSRQRLRGENEVLFRAIEQKILEYSKNLQNIEIELRVIAQTRKLLSTYSYERVMQAMMNVQFVDNSTAFFRFR